MIWKTTWTTTSKRHKDVRQGTAEAAGGDRALGDRRCEGTGRRPGLQCVAQAGAGSRAGLKGFSEDEMVPEQKAYFLAHPPPRDDGQAIRASAGDHRCNLLFHRRGVYSEAVFRLFAPAPAKPKRVSKLLVPRHAPLHSIFEQEYRGLRPIAPMPALDIRFRRFTISEYDDPAARGRAAGAALRPAGDGTGERCTVRSRTS